MTIKALVLSDRPDEYTGKKGLVKQQVITVIDQEVGYNRLTQPLEYSMESLASSKVVVGFRIEQATSST